MKQLTFICPKCKHHELGSVESVIMTYPITEITDEDVVYDSDNPTAGDSQILSYQCLHCGFELEDEQGNNWMEYPGDVPGTLACVHISEDTSPRGVSMWSRCYPDSDLGKEITFEDLPNNVQEQVIAWMVE